MRGKNRVKPRRGSRSPGGKPKVEPLITKGPVRPSTIPRTLCSKFSAIRFADVVEPALIADVMLCELTIYLLLLCPWLTHFQRQLRRWPPRQCLYWISASRRKQLEWHRSGSHPCSSTQPICTPPALPYRLTLMGFSEGLEALRISEGIACTMPRPSESSKSDSRTTTIVRGSQIRLS